MLAGNCKSTYRQRKASNLPSGFASKLVKPIHDLAPHLNEDRQDSIKHLIDVVHGNEQSLEAYGRYLTVDGGLTEEEVKQIKSGHKLADLWASCA
jgi:hypothetical protein